MWTTRSNQELKEMYKDLDIVADVKKKENGEIGTSSKNGLWKES